MTIRSALAMSLFLLGGVDGARATILESTLAPTAAEPVKRLAIVSLLGNTLHLVSIGTVVFQNRGYDAPVPEWNVDDKVQQQFIGAIRETGHISAEISPLAASTPSKVAILSAARDGRFDVVLAVLPETDPNDRPWPAGPSLRRRELFGHSGVNVCNGMVVRAWRVRDGFQINVSVPSPCGVPHTTLAWHDQWSEYTEAENQSLQEQLQSVIQAQLDRVLVDLYLRQPIPWYQRKKP